MRSKIVKSKSSKNLRKSRNRVGSKRRTKNSRNRRGPRSKLVKRVKGGATTTEAEGVLCEGVHWLDNHDKIANHLSEKFTTPKFSKKFKNKVKAFFEQTKLTLPCKEKWLIKEEDDGYMKEITFLCGNNYIFVRMKNVLKDLLKGHESFNDSDRLFYLAELPESEEDLKLKKIEINKKKESLRKAIKIRDKHNKHGAFGGPHDQEPLGQMWYTIIPPSKSYATVQEEINQLRPQIQNLTNDLKTTVLQRTVKTIQAVKNNGDRESITINGDDSSFRLLDIFIHEESPYCLVMKSCSPVS